VTSCCRFGILHCRYNGLCEVAHYILPLFCHFLQLPSASTLMAYTSTYARLLPQQHPRPHQISNHRYKMCSEKRINMVHTCGHHSISSTHPPYITVCPLAVARTPAPHLPVIPCYPHIVMIMTVQVATVCGAEECRAHIEAAKQQRERGRRRVEEWMG